MESIVKLDLAKISVRELNEHLHHKLAGNGARPQVSKYGIPIVRGPIAETERDARLSSRPFRGSLPP